METNVDILLDSRTGWIGADVETDNTIAVSSRIRFARNLAGHPFPINASDDIRVATAQEIASAVRLARPDDEFIDFDLGAMPPNDRQFLLERRLVSNEFCQGNVGSILTIRCGETLGVMANEEDHLRLQSLRSGFRLHEAWEDIDSFDDALSSHLDFAFDTRLGFLTSCMTNVGTGMRASVMLHLPALRMAGQIEPVMRGLAKLGLAVRGLYGEGSECDGDLYQISNQSTLGESESQIIERMQELVSQIISHEEKARVKLLRERRNNMLDVIGRSYGILRHAYVLNVKDALSCLSLIRLGVDVGVFEKISSGIVMELYSVIQPAHIQKTAKSEISPDEMDVRRAAIVRSKLKC